MEVESVINLVKMLLASGIPDVFVWAIFLIFAVLLPMKRRLDGISSYIVRFLAIEQRRVKAIEKLDKSIAALAKHVGCQNDCED